MPTPLSIEQLLQQAGVNGVPGGRPVAPSPMAPYAFRRDLEQARQNPNMPAIPGQMVVVENLVAESTRIAQRAREWAAPPAVPQPDLRSTPVPAGPPPANAPDVATQAALGNLSGLMGEMIRIQKMTVNSLHAIQMQLALQFKFKWMTLVGSEGIAPSRFFGPLLGSDYASGTYAEFYRNDRQYPVGIRVSADWTTPGGILNLSMTKSDQGIWATLENGGPNGGTLTIVKVLLPSQVVYAANGDAGVPLVAGDVFRVRINDPTEYLDDQAFQVMPYSPE